MSLTDPRGGLKRSKNAVRFVHVYSTFAAVFSLLKIITMIIARNPFWENIKISCDILNWKKSLYHTPENLPIYTVTLMSLSKDIWNAFLTVSLFSWQCFYLLGELAVSYCKKSESTDLLLLLILLLLAGTLSDVVMDAVLLIPVVPITCTQESSKQTNQGQTYPNVPCSLRCCASARSTRLIFSLWNMWIWVWLYDYIQVYVDIFQNGACQDRGICSGWHGKPIISYTQPFL